MYSELKIKNHFNFTVKNIQITNNNFFFFNGEFKTFVAFKNKHFLI